ncbi:nucleoside hydrolase [Flavobacteriaceae bacterium F89]|uniref:Nucleoside hydrolase n=1 Tax=Cerina litoralis TaxID=2874477 RepID=A0AAE3EZI5_9FLAO|nr:nucleoside hydrolase [Cerina litoralis]MCG2462501.1 nucleoside hydrolase [Cerina litoralis]
MDATHRISVIFDTDANNELDDQHAMAYLFTNRETFDIKAVTVNATRNGGDIEEQYAEADRIMRLFKVEKEIPLLKGANESFINIEKNLDNTHFDGYEAVNFIIAEAKKHKDEKLVIIAVGKLTNLALALKKEPSIAKNIRLVWLGSNYPAPGEYNLENDIPSMNYVLKTNIQFEMVTVRYGEPSGTDAVRITKEEAFKIMPGLGPQLTSPVVGRHGGEYYNFGDYSVSLFQHIKYHGTPPSRALFDMAAVAIVKNPKWAQPSIIPCPIMINDKWIEQPGNRRKITIWENFDKESIIKDFIQSLTDYKH